MSIRVALHHQTIYRYDRPVTLSPHVVRLRPAPHCRTPVTSYSLRVQPSDHFVNWQQDPHGNFIARYTFPTETTTLSLEVDLVAEMTVINPFDFFLEPHAEQYPFAYDELQQRELAPFLTTAPPGPRLVALLASVTPAPGTRVHLITFLVELNRRLQGEIRYVIRLEPGYQTSEDTLSLGSGSCRDTAWLLVQTLRHLGLAARFVSGYLIQLKPDERPLDGPAGPDADFTDLHAWTEVYVPGAGWIGLDPTSGLLAGEGHIPLAATPHPESASPVTGMVTPCEVTFHHEMSVTRIHEDPRVTKPYSEEQWDRLLALGDRVDRELDQGDVRLTMGGEPTLVAIDDMDAEEWSTAAVGPSKRRLASAFIRRLREAFAPSGLLHVGQGKWYPGESLPRWALTCYWRTDGLPLWHDSTRSADPDRDGGCGPAEAERFTEALADRLAVGRAQVMAAYEDPLAYIHAERQLPVDVDPEHNTLDDPEERERLRRVFSRGLGQPSGFVLPLARVRGKSGPEWQSGSWMLRSRHVFLVPGDSPIGFRLPIHSLPTGPAHEIFAVDPMRAWRPLPVPGAGTATAARQAESRGREGGDGSVVEPQLVERRAASEPDRRQAVHEQMRPGPDDAPGLQVRTALTVEPRGGQLWVFLPPVASADDYVDLIAAVEAAASDTDLPVLIEGYPPPFDPRLQKIAVTPDPGVIEVNVPPAASWRTLVSNTIAVYDLARRTRLSAEKFLLDGRHTGTGGGNHLVLGAASPGDSPFLRRPDLLKSFVGYWLNHPSLSYLFSGMFVGPTSQAPRVDETRADAIYELEIAMGLLRGASPGCPPWLVDRLFRHLLVDVTGNTHRAEFCIDKLYSPDSASGRLGLVEMRAFEMPPHPRMSLVQQLLVRTLLAWFWREPYEGTPVRWGTRLHDRFMLPFYVEQDLAGVLDDLVRAGYAMERAWFDPHMEFRFPLYGRVCYQGTTIELRQAIEPWYVLGEEPGAGGTARYVDSSVERLQVRVTGLLPERYAVACNGLALPLQPTGVASEFVCGVRFRAWQPPRCLHPTIPVHAPLVFDLVDTDARRSIGGCTYHVGHPGGRSYDTLPVNSSEAEARRRARFVGFGHTPSSPLIPIVTSNPECPSTLDLRRWPARPAHPAGARRG